MKKIAKYAKKSNKFKIHAEIFKTLTLLKNINFIDSYVYNWRVCL